MSGERSQQKRTILHDIPDDAKFVKVATSTFCAKRFLESDLHVRDEVLVERGIDDGITKSQDQHVLDHLFAEVVVDAEGLP